MAIKNKKKMEQDADEEKKPLEAAAEMEYAADEAEDEKMEAEADSVAMEAEGSGLEDQMDAGGIHDEMASDEDEDEEEMEAACGGKAKMSKFKNRGRSEKALFERVRALEQANETLERQLRLERFGREVDALITAGYRCSKFRNSMVEELADASSPETKVAFWKATMARDPIGMAPIAKAAVTDEAPAIDPRAATERAVREANGNLDKFKQLFSKYSGQKA